MTSLRYAMRGHYIFDATKHDLAKDYGLKTPGDFADMRLNEMNNVELVEALSDALDDVLARYKEIEV